MNILLCNNTLSMFAGSETATYSMAVELIRRGHKVTAFSFHLGEMGKKMEVREVNVIDNLDGHEGDFDLAICNHFDPTNYVKAKLPRVPIIFTTHGIIGGPETPPLYCDHFVAVSEEVQTMLKEKYKIDSTIIRNGVDLDRFKEVKPANQRLRKVLISSSYYTQNSKVFQTLQSALNILDIEIHAAGREFKWVWAMEEVYNQVDAVITLGRGCVEAMACNRPVICLGHWGINQELSSDGLIDSESYMEIRKNNFSSRRFRKEWTLKDVIKELNKTMDLKINSRDIISKEHDIKHTVDQYLNLIK